MNRRKPGVIVADLFCMLLLIGVDQYTKYVAVTHLKYKPAVPVIPDVLEFKYLENRGAAFGMLQNQKVFFIFVALLIVAVIVGLLFRIPAQKKYTVLHVLLVMIAAGATGNMIDRLHLDYVVDFISFVLIHFPIFNVADIYVTVATCILAVLLLFYYQEEDLNFLSFFKTDREP